MATLEEVPHWAPKDWSVVGLKEPLKTRIVTSGPAVSNGLFTDLQQKMFRSIKRFWQFKLTEGGQLERNDSLNFLMFEAEEDPETLNWVSGDYSDATNSLNVNATKAAISGFDESLHKLLLDNLCSGVLHHKVVENGVELRTETEQKNGQLMGSLFSFPILCAINLAMFRLVYERFHKRRVPIRLLPVLVNGDDILFRQSVCFTRIWKEETSGVGLEPSVGKCYESKDFCIVNSRLMRVKRGFLIYKAVPYVNMGLVYGVAKGDTRQASVETLRERCAVLDGALANLSKDWDKQKDTDVFQAMVKNAKKRYDITYARIPDFHLGLTKELPQDREQQQKWIDYSRLSAAIVSKRVEEERKQSLKDGILVKNPGPFRCLIDRQRSEAIKAPLSIYQRKGPEFSFRLYLETMVKYFAKKRELEEEDAHFALKFEQYSRLIKKPFSSVLDECHTLLHVGDVFG
jgi:hypothetical protein